jgi:hypothetical protein
MLLVTGIPPGGIRSAAWAVSSGQATRSAKVLRSERALAHPDRDWEQAVAHSAPAAHWGRAAR